MKFERLLKSELLALCEELGVEVSSAMKNPDIIRAIREENMPDIEVELMWQKLEKEKEDEATRKDLEEVDWRSS